MTEELKPCPFCGGSAIDCGKDDICCTTPGCAMANKYIPLKEWNTRAEPAPSSDVETDIGTVECIGRCLGGAFERDLLAHAKRIRAHIAALEHKHDDLVTRCVQAESDRDALEAKLAEQIREDEMRLINHCIKIIDNNSRSHLHAEAEFLTKIAELEEQINLMSKHQAGVDEKLCELEAENKRLREVLRTCEGRILNAQIGINTGDTKAGLSKYLDAVLSIVRNAIAQTGEKS